MFQYSLRICILCLCCQGMFRWQFRSRVRITLMGKNIQDPPIELHDQQLLHPENRYAPCVTAKIKSEVKL